MIQAFSNIDNIHLSWQDCITQGLAKMDPHYLSELDQQTDWLPGKEYIFNAFNLPLDKTRYVLFGESPYPRKQSANGYAFWDQAVGDIWSETGMSKPVNRATSLRHIIKALLIADGLLKPNQTTQPDIALVDKTTLVKTNAELFGNFIHAGFLLLNATPVLRKNNVRKDAVAWKPFIRHVLAFLYEHQPDIHFILLGNIANDLTPLLPEGCTKKLFAEHPYNHTFIQNPEILHFFRDLQLLKAYNPKLG